MSYLNRREDVASLNLRVWQSENFDKVEIDKNENVTMPKETFESLKNTLCNNRGFITTGTPLESQALLTITDQNIPLKKKLFEEKIQGKIKEIQGELEHLYQQEEYIVEGTDRYKWLCLVKTNEYYLSKMQKSFKKIPMIKSSKYFDFKFNNNLQHYGSINSLCLKRKDSEEINFAAKFESEQNLLLYKEKDISTQKLPAIEGKDYYASKFDFNQEKIEEIKKLININMPLDEKVNMDDYKGYAFSYIMTILENVNFLCDFLEKQPQELFLKEKDGLILDQEDKFNFLIPSFNRRKLVKIVDQKNNFGELLLIFSHTQHAQWIESTKVKKNRSNFLKNNFNAPKLDAL